MERLPDCLELEALVIEYLHEPMPAYLKACFEHESTCAYCAEIRRTDAVLEGVPEVELEPPCSCHQTDVDLFDARGCELHDSTSAWNARTPATMDITVWDVYLPGLHVAPTEVF
jgi:hypothetical protein